MLTGMIILYLFIAWAKSIHFFAVSRLPYQISFHNVSGLMEDDPVNVFGHPSGNVTEIELTRTGAIVSISLDDEIQLFQDAQAEIRIKELMGGKMIEIFPGQSGTVLASGSTFSGSTSMDFSTAFSKFGTLMENLDMQQMDSMVANLNQITGALAGISSQFNQEDMKTMFSQLNASAKSLNNILHEVESRGLVGKVDGAVDKLDRLSNGANGAMNSFNNIATHIESKTLPQSDSLLQQLSGFLTQTESTLEEAKNMVAELKTGNSAAGKALFDPEFALKIDHAVDNLNKTLDHIRTNKLHVAMSLSHKNKEYREVLKEEKPSEDK